MVANETFRIGPEVQLRRSGHLRSHALIRISTGARELEAQAGIHAASHVVPMVGGNQAQRLRVKLRYE